jgi:hypothetical protein
MLYSIAKKENTIYWPIVLVLLILPLVAGCLHSSTSTTAGGTPFTIELWASAKCVKAGDTLTVRATVTNRDSQTRLVELKDQPVLDLVIGYHGVTGDTSIRWSDGKPLSTALTHLELKPGESKSIEIRWVVVDPAPSTVGITARFIDDARFTHRPLSPYMVIYGPNLCPGPFGP